MLTNREVILAKLESVYNIDAAPEAANDAILIENPSWSNEGVKMIERPAIRSSLSTLKQIYGGGLMTVSFSVEIKGSGVAGTAPEIGVLLRACAMQESVVASTSVTYKPRSSGHESITIYYFQDGTLRKLTGAKGNATFRFEAGNKGMVEFTFTGHTAIEGQATAGGVGTLTLPENYPAVDDVFNGQKITFLRGTGAGQTGTITDYDGTTKVATISGLTTDGDATTVFSIDNGPIDRALPSATYDSTVPPPFIAAPFTIGAFGAVIAALECSLNNEISTPESVASPDGYGEIIIGKRDPSGSFNPEAVLVATYDFEGKFKSSEAQELDTGVVGLTEGNRYQFKAPAVSYREVAPGERGGKRTYEITYGAAETSAGDDDIELIFT